MNTIKTLEQADPSTFSVGLTERSLRSGVARLGKKISEDYKDCEVLDVVVVLSGGFMFAADLVRQITIPVRMHFVSATSYVGTKQQEQVKLGGFYPLHLNNCDVLLVDDILDTGSTLEEIKKHISRRTIKTAVLLEREFSTTRASYGCFTVPKGDFYVGYGLDYNGFFRNLPEICLLPKELYENL